MTARILVACIGNIFMGDDAFGVEVARALNDHRLPSGVEVVDFGIRGYDLAYALQDGYEITIMVDATQRGEEPGTLYVIEPDNGDLNELAPHPGVAAAHGLNPEMVFRLVRAMGGKIGRVLIVGCEPETLGDELEGDMGLSESVRRAVPEAVRMILSLVESITIGEATGTPG